MLLNLTKVKFWHVKNSFFCPKCDKHRTNFPKQEFPNLFSILSAFGKNGNAEALHNESVSNNSVEINEVTKYGQTNLNFQQNSLAENIR